MTELTDRVEDVVVVDAEDSTRTRRQPRLAVVIAVVVVLVGGGTFGYWQWDARIEANLVAAVDALESAVRGLDDAVADGEEVLTTSEARVEEEQVRTTLADALADAATLETGAPTEGSRQARASAAEDIRADVAEHAEAVRGASTTVTEAVSAWELAQAVDAFDAAVAGLGEVIASGEQTLAETEGQVLDNAVREQLRTALDAAIRVRDAAVDAEDIAAVTAASEQVGAAHADATAAEQSAVDARGAWQAEQDQIAAEQAAATQKSGTGNRSSGSSKGSTGASAPAANSGTPSSSSTGSSGSSGGSAPRCIAWETLPIGDIETDGVSRPEQFVCTAWK